MDNRKNKLDSTLIDIVNNNVNSVSFNYSTIRDRINYNVGEVKKVGNNLKYSSIFKLSVALSLTFVFILTIIFATSNTGQFALYTESNYKTGESLKEILEDKDFSIITYTTPDLYSLVHDMRYVDDNISAEVNVPTVNEGDYYAVYLKKSVLKRLEKFLKDPNELKNSYVFSCYNFYKGTNNLLAKYNYYCYKNNLNCYDKKDGYKWIVKNKISDIKVKVDSYQLVAIINCRSIKEFTNLLDNSIINVNIRLVSEIKFNISNKHIDVLEDENLVLGGKYLINYFPKLYQEKTFIPNLIFHNNYVKIDNINGKEALLGIMYKGIIDYEKKKLEGLVNDDLYCDIAIAMRDLIKPYLIEKQLVPNNLNDGFDEYNYYDYEGIKELFLSFKQV